MPRKKGRPPSTSSAGDREGETGDAVPPDLLRSARHGDQSARCRLIALCEARLSEALRDRAARAGDLDSLKHEVLVRVWLGMSRVPEIRHLRAWLLGVAHHVRLEELRSERTTRRAGVDFENLARPLERGDRVELSELTLNLTDKLRSLPARLRDATVQHYLDGLSERSIARSSAIPEGTVRRWISEARERLRLVVPSGTPPFPAPQSQDAVPSRNRHAAPNPSSTTCGKERRT